ncbi:hypothetical protein Tco_0766689 [Tanacetum coccineum]
MYDVIHHPFAIYPQTSYACVPENYNVSPLSDSYPGLQPTTPTADNLNNDYQWASCLTVIGEQASLKKLLELSFKEALQPNSASEPTYTKPKTLPTTHIAEWQNVRVEADARMSITPVLLSPSTGAGDCDYFLRAWNSEAGESFQRAENFNQTIKVAELLAFMAKNPTLSYYEPEPAPVPKTKTEIITTEMLSESKPHDHCPRTLPWLDFSIGEMLVNVQLQSYQWDSRIEEGFQKCFVKHASSRWNDMLNAGSTRAIRLYEKNTRGSRSFNSTRKYLEIKHACHIRSTELFIHTHVMKGTKSLLQPPIVKRSAGGNKAAIEKRAARNGLAGVNGPAGLNKPAG